MGGPHVDEWQYHQDGRDMAVEMGARLLIGMAVGAVGFGVLSVVVGGLTPWEGVAASLLAFIAEFGLCCII